jgi:hypothetical protein
MHPAHLQAFDESRRAIISRLAWSVDLSRG